MPHPTTVQRDLIHIYEHASTWVMNYFLVFFIICFAVKYRLIGGVYSGIKQHYAPSS